ncbi:MAG: hypothetical protein WBP45_13245 [Daejeonella sp.]
MKLIYNKIIELLGEIPEIQWTDLDKGQLEFYKTRPAVQFPCALVKIELPRCDDEGNKIQQCTALITIRLGFDFTGETTSITPEPNRTSALAYFDIVEKVYQKLQGFSNDQLSTFSRKRCFEENRNDGLKVINIPFETEFEDYTAAD